MRFQRASNDVRTMLDARRVVGFWQGGRNGESLASCRWLRFVIRKGHPLGQTEKRKGAVDV